MGMTFAILNLSGTIPVDNERLKIWQRGLAIRVEICLSRQVEIPVISVVFLFSRLAIPSSISFVEVGDE